MSKNLLNFYGIPTVFQALCSEHSVNRIDTVLILIEFMLDPDKRYKTAYFIAHCKD